MDVVIPLSNQSKNGDFELKYLLRSLERNYADLDLVWIIGNHVPEWLNTKKCELVSLVDQFGPTEQDKNMIHKIGQLCRDYPVSELFLRCSDDNALLMPSRSAAFRFYQEKGPFHTGDIFESAKQEAENTGDHSISLWRKRLVNTGMAMEAIGRPFMNYEIHIPVIYSRSEFSELLTQFPDYAQGEGYTINSLYFNFFATKYAPGSYLMDKYDLRASINGMLTSDADVRERCRGKLFLTYNDDGLNKELRRYLKIQFPTKSKYEL